MALKSDSDKPTTSKVRHARRKITCVDVSESVKRKLREGEVLYWTDKAPHKGKFVAYSRWRDALGRRQRSKTRSFDTDKDALAFLMSLRKEQERVVGRYADRPLRDWFDFVSESRWPTRISSVTIDNKKSRWARFIGPFLGDAPMRTITRAVIVAWLDEMIERETPHSQLVEAKNDLHKLFEDAIDLEEYDRNPVRGAELSASELRDKIVLGPAKIVELLDKMSDAQNSGKLPGWIVGMTACGLLAGLRKGECQALSWGTDGLDLARGFINIHRAAHRDEDGVLSVGLPKGGKKRSVAIPPQLREVLSSFAPDDLEAAIQEGRLVWSTRSGGMYQPKQIKSWFDKLKSACSLPDSMQFRDTRATYASLVDHLALGQKTTLELMGHERIQVTTERYMESLDESKRDAAQKLGRALKPRRGRSQARATPPESRSVERSPRTPREG